MIHHANRNCDSRRSKRKPRSGSNRIPRNRGNVRASAVFNSMHSAWGRFGRNGATHRGRSFLRVRRRDDWRRRVAVSVCRAGDARFVKDAGSGSMRDKPKHPASPSSNLVSWLRFSFVLARLKSGKPIAALAMWQGGLEALQPNHWSEATAGAESGSPRSRRRRWRTRPIPRRRTAFRRWRLAGRSEREPEELEGGGEGSLFRSGVAVQHPDEPALCVYSLETAFFLANPSAFPSTERTFLSSTERHSSTFRAKLSAARREPTQGFTLVL
jgi:hypothetical protein